jgi:hypothetical protein
MLNGPVCKMFSPFMAKGRKSHKNRIKRFAYRIRLRNFFTCILANVAIMSEIIRPKRTGKNLSDTETASEKANAVRILTPGFKPVYYGTPFCKAFIDIHLM